MRAAARRPGSVVIADTPETLLDRIDAAVEARAHLAGRPLAATATALAAAARRWCEDQVLGRDLPAEAALSPAMVRRILPLAAEALDAAAMIALAERALGAEEGGARR